jgi:hypothetical protein
MRFNIDTNSNRYISTRNIENGATITVVSDKNRM